MEIDHLDTGRALDWERALFDDVAARPEKRFLKFWKGTQSLVVPKKIAVHPDFPEAKSALDVTGWPVHLRATGGDVTPQGTDILNVTHVYTWESDWPFDIEAAYDRICAPIEAALGTGAARGWQPGAFCDGAYNVQWDGRKFAGTALRFRPSRKVTGSHTVLAHALMLMAPPPDATLQALNRFLSALGEERRIDPAAHTGLPRGQSIEGFLAQLKSAFERDMRPY